MDEYNRIPPEPDLRCTDTVYKGVISGTLLAIHFMRRNPTPGGKIVVTASVSSIYPHHTYPEYSGAKAAVLNFMRSAAPILNLVRNSCPTMNLTLILASNWWSVGDVQKERREKTHSKNGKKDGLTLYFISERQYPLQRRPARHRAHTDYATGDAGCS